MSENPFAPVVKPYEAFRAVARFGAALVEHPSDILPLLFVAERTASWQKAADAVSVQQFVAGIRRRDGVAIRSGCGLQRTALKQALAPLEKRGLLIRERRQSKRGADGPSEYRIAWKRVAEMIETTVILVGVKRPPGGRETTPPPVATRPHSKDSYSKDSYSRKNKHTVSQAELFDPGLCASADAQVGGSALAKIRPPDGYRPEWFDEWWAIYWRRVAKKAAQKAFQAHVKTQQRFEQVMAATKAQTPAMMAREPDKRPHGATWLNGERWNDEPSAPARKGPSKSPTVEQLAQQIEALGRMR